MMSQLLFHVKLIFEAVFFIKAKAQTSLYSMAFGYEFWLWLPNFLRNVLFWEAWHFGVLNYAVHRLSYPEVATNKCIQEFGKRIAFVNKLTTPIMYRTAHYFSRCRLLLYSSIFLLISHSSSFWHLQISRCVINPNKALFLFYCIS